MRTRPPMLDNVTQWVVLPCGWTLAIEGKRRKYQARVWEE